MNMKDFRHFSCGTLHGEVGQIRSYRPPFRRALGLIIHFIGLSGKRYFEPLEHYLDVWYTGNHGKHHYHRNHEDAGNHS